MQTPRFPVVIIGAGHAGGTMVAQLRQQGWTGRIVLIGAEPHLPYQRPPLSKAWLLGEADAASLALKPDSYYDTPDLRVLTGVQALRIDRGTRIVSLSNGEMIFYHALVLATGSRLHQLRVPGSDLAPVLQLRSMADADRLKAELQQRKRLAIIGGGYIGLEVAASARAAGCDVTLIEREPRLLARVASEPISVLYDHRHREAGVTLELGATVTAIEGADGRVKGVRLGDGRLVPCDVVVVGIGAVAEDALAQKARLDCDNGILVDANSRTSSQNIFAIGDCARRPVPVYGRSLRLESVPNALEQAKQAASAICGKPAPAPEVPWFWSDQYDLKLQIAGVPLDATHHIVRWQQGTSRFAVFHLDAEHRLRAVEAVNSAADFMAGKTLIAKRTPLDATKLADPSIPLKQFIT